VSGAGSSFQQGDYAFDHGRLLHRVPVTDNLDFSAPNHVADEPDLIDRAASRYQRRRDG